MGPFADALWGQQPQQRELASDSHTIQQAVLRHDAGGPQQYDLLVTPYSMGKTAHMLLLGVHSECV